MNDFFDFLRDFGWTQSKADTSLWHYLVEEKVTMSLFVHTDDGKFGYVKSAKDHRDKFVDALNKRFNIGSTQLNIDLTLDLTLTLNKTLILETPNQNLREPNALAQCRCVACHGTLVQSCNRHAQFVQATLVRISAELATARAIDKNPNRMRMFSAEYEAFVHGAHASNRILQRMLAQHHSSTCDKSRAAVYASFEHALQKEEARGFCTLPLSEDELHAFRGWYTGIRKSGFPPPFGQNRPEPGGG